MSKFAILLSGMSNKRHVDDLEFLYRTLIDKHYYPVQNIVVANLDGTLSYRDSQNNNQITSLEGKLWPGDNTPYSLHVNFPGTHLGFSKAIGLYASTIGSNSSMFLHVNNHGGNNSNPYEPSASFISTYGGNGGNDWGAYYTENDILNAIKTLRHCGQFICMMEQCHSGGFKDVICNGANADRISFAAAATYARNSYGSINWDTFAKDWISAAANAQPNGEPLSPPLASSNLVDIFNWTCNQDHTEDTPVYLDYPRGAGYTMTL